MFAQNKDILLSYIFQMFPFSKSFPKTKRGLSPFRTGPVMAGLCSKHSRDHPFDAIFGSMPHAVIRHKVQSVRFFGLAEPVFLLSCRDTVAVYCQDDIFRAFALPIAVFCSHYPLPKIK